MGRIVPSKLHLPGATHLKLSPEAIHGTSTSRIPHAHRPLTLTSGESDPVVVNGRGLAEWSK